MTTIGYAARFEQKRYELREIARSLGRDDIFDRDLRGEASFEKVAPNSNRAIEDAISGVGWYLEEEYEHLDEYAREAAHDQDPRVKKYREIVRYVEGR